jgi:hypothetical protein
MSPDGLALEAPQERRTSAGRLNGALQGRLALLVPLLVALCIVLLEAPRVYSAYTEPLDKPGDFLGYYYAGELAMRGDRADLYTQDLAVQEEFAEQHHFRLLGVFLYPPATALAMVPLALLPVTTAVVVWRVLTVAAVAALAWIVARTFERWEWRILAIVCIAFWPPLSLNAEINQAGAFTPLAVAGLSLLYLTRRKLATLLFLVLALKPSAALGPAALVAGTWPQRCYLFFAPFVLMILGPFLLWGSEAFANYRSTAHRLLQTDMEGRHPLQVGLTAGLHLGGVLGMELFAILGMGVIYIVYRRQKRLEEAASLAILAGFLLNPHSMLYDAAFCFAVVMLLRRAEFLPMPDLTLGCLMLTLFVAGALSWPLNRAFVYPFPPLAAWALVVFALVALAPVYQDRQQQAPP